jgi:SAM-dependent methyltransferase
MEPGPKDSAGSFSGFFAEFYDILHAGLDDVDAYVEYASRFGPRVLELGCGTGRILIPLACAGFTVTGVDSSGDMIAICRERLGYEPEDVQQGSRSFNRMQGTYTCRNASTSSSPRATS